MVAFMQLLLSLSFLQNSGPTYDELFPQSRLPEVLSIRLVSESSRSIKPCQPFTAVFEVRLADQALRSEWAQVARQASKVLRINDVDFTNRLSEGSTNSACEFRFLWPEPTDGAAPPRSAESALISADCQINAITRSCLFLEPGQYRIEFVFGDHNLETRLAVNHPTGVERKIVDRLNVLPMLLFLRDPTDSQYATPENLGTLEELVAIPSDYSSLLGMVLSLAKQRVRDPSRAELTPEEKREELTARFALLQPVTREARLTRRIAALAAWDLAMTAGALARLEPNPEKRTEYTSLQATLFERVSDCPLVPRERALAQAAASASEQNPE